MRNLCGPILLTGLLLAGANTAHAVPDPGANSSSGVQQLLSRARDARQHGDLRVATLLLKNAVQAAPKNGAIQAELGGILVMQNQTAEGERLLRHARELHAPDALVLPALFQAMLSNHENQALVDQFPEPAAGAPNAADILRARALALFALKKQDEADAAIDKALAVHRTAPLLVNKAEFSLARGNRAAAEALIDEALKLSPDDSTALITKIGLLERTGTPDRAVSFADRLVKSSPGQPLPLVLRIELMARLQRYRDAGTDVDRLLAIAPKLPVALYYRALLLAQKGDIKGAWQIAQGLPPDFLHSDPQYGLGFAKIAQAAGNQELSTASLTATVSAFPKDEEARRALAQRRLAQRDFAAALDTMQPLLASTDPQNLALIGRAYQGQGKNREAQSYFDRAKQPANSVDDLKRAVQADGGNADKVGTLVSVLLARGQTDQARQVVDRFDAAAPKNPMTVYFRAQIAMTDGDLDQAAQGFNATLKAQPGFSPALFYLSQVQAAQGDLAGAQAHLDQMLRADPHNLQALLKKAQYALQQGDDGTAIRVLRQASAAAPESLEPKLALGQLYLSRGKFQQAQAIAASAMKQAPASVEAVALLARADIGMGATDRARQAAAALAKAQPASAPAQVLLGSVSEQAKDGSSAQAAYAAAVRLDPHNPAGYRALANYYVQAGQNKPAEDTARRLVAGNAGADANLFLADILARTGKKPAAIAVLQNGLAHGAGSRTLVALATLQADTDRKSAEKRLTAWIAQHPSDVAIRSQLATMLMADGDDAGARTQLEAALKLQPYNASVMNDLAWAVQKSDGARSLKLAAQAAKLSPQSGEILDTLGWLKWQSDRKEGLRLLRQAHDLSPLQPAIAYHLAVALAQSGDRAAAKNMLAIALKPGSDKTSRDQALKLQASWHAAGE